MSTAETGLVLAAPGGGNPECGGLLGFGAFQMLLALGSLDAVSKRFSW